VGQVAIQVAQHFRMEIFVTVGFVETKMLIKDTYGIPEDHILIPETSALPKAS
jgi:hypothetical protein